ncbi:MAG: SsrA-binding protein SmpB [Candidatus Kaelpia imicola]|nr:SsrA-binding protein SmpB [Candidatus Kaelpia imicola]
MDRVVLRNKKVRRDFYVEYTIEAGIVLCGSEVKSLREGKASLSDSFALIEGGEVFLYNFHINPYKFSSVNHEPKRKRKLLLNKREISRLVMDVQKKGFTLIPLSVYFKDSRLIKVEIALARGKKKYDKREDLKKKVINAEIDRELKKRR